MTSAPEHDRDHPHDHGHDHPHDHGHDHHHHDHGHGVLGALRHALTPHSHDTADSVDDALEASGQGIRAVKVSLLGLGATALLQLAIVAVSGSVALMADTVHNLSAALTAVPLWIAFVLGRRRPSDRYPGGLGRAEDLAGLFIVAMIALSAILTGVESVRRLAEPREIDHLGWVLAAGIIGFVGNEAVALYRIRVGRRIGSAALVADGIHARTDGFTSLAVVLGVIGVWVGFPLADPLVGLLITVAIAVLLVGTARDVGRRLLDGVDPDLTRTAREVLENQTSVQDHDHLRLRWSGHRLQVTAELTALRALDLHEADELAGHAEQALREALPSVGEVQLAVRAPRPERAQIS